MSGGRDQLVYMANQIAMNLAAMGEGSAAEATADHIASFWNPRMKAPLLADRSGLSPIAANAFAILDDDPRPPHQSRATEFGSTDAAGNSDAG